VEPLQVIVLSLIQGVTEFLPVSSAAHLIIPAQLTHWQDQGLLFDVAVHLGSLTSIVVYFRRELIQFAVSATRMHWDDSSQLLSKVAVATIPVIGAGILFKPLIETELRTISVIGITTIAFGLALWWADRRVESTRDEYAITFVQAGLIGMAQVLALIPGTSRSGITITAALLAGIGREGAARFSFLLAIPTITGAALLSTVEAFNSQESVNWNELGTGFALSAASSYACIAIFIALINRIHMTPYVVYRILLGSLLLVFL
jgi:undecaprenyl-diphosphatase